MEKITVQAVLSADKKMVWDLYTQPEHITNWNFADPSWHCPSASNDLTIGGRYVARMEAKDGSFGFDFEATYVDVVPYEHFTYVFGDRLATVRFHALGGKIEVVIQFDPETENSLELQQQGWQAILNQFKRYVELQNTQG
jgi:uncharacterized protein YndB with AHSA1/START domain